MMSVCDIVVVINIVKFGLIEVCFGLIFVIISFYVVVWMGEGKVCCVFMLVWLFGVEEVNDFGFVLRVVNVYELDDVVE